MPIARFVLKEPKSKLPTLVYLLLRFNKQKLKYSTGLKIQPKLWNENRQMAREITTSSFHISFNRHLKDLSEVAEQTYSDLLAAKERPTVEKIKEALDTVRFKNTPQQEEKITLLKFIEHFIQTSNRNISTIKQYKLCLNNLIEYSETHKEIDFENIDIAFYDEFVRFLMSKNYSANTIGARIKNIKVFMNDAVERGLTNNRQFQGKRFKVYNEPSENIYLSVEEIKKMYELDLTNNPRLEKVRDLFIIACYTGLRFSDLIQLRDENFIDGNTKIKIKTQKTGEVVVIPLHKYIREILKKYNGMPPQKISNQKMNDYLKELGEKAEIDEEIILSTVKGGSKQIETYKKHNLITVHTARRSFATNAYLNDIPSISIMKITGHSTEKAFLSYIKISQEENANKLLNHPFFN